jgi:hypothetical protein
MKATTHARFLALLALAPASAFAQEGGGAAPAAPAASAPAAGGGAGAGSGRGGGFVVTDDEDVPNVYGMDEGDGAQVHGGEVPPVHVVRKGDTLWDICRQYFNNPWHWPKVWSYNPSITNPHWIFPGDRVNLYASAGDLPLPDAGPAEGKHRRFQRLGGVFGGNGMALRELGFVDEGELKAAARITGSREEKLMLSHGDQAYVEYPSDHPLHVGERYTVYKVERPVVHPVTHAPLGYVVLILGEVQVDQVTQGGIARSTIVDANGAIERGYRVGALARRWKSVEPRANGQSLDGYVVGALHPLDIIDSEEIVFVDRGHRDGVADGNRFFVVRRGDGYRKLLTDDSVLDDPRYPKEVIAEIVVVEAHERTSVGYVARTSKEVHPGDRVEMRRGY